MKLAPATLSVSTGFTSVDSVVLQVTPNRVPVVGASVTVSVIWLFAVTAVVLICKVGVAPVGTATLPAAAEPQTAGDAAEAQFVAVE